MNAIKFLAGLALVQAILVPITWHRPDPTPPGSKPVFAVDRDEIAQIRVAESGADPSSVTLSRDGDAWVVASAADYPAKADEVEALLTAIDELSYAGDPVAAQRVSHQALDVADAEFGRRVEVTDRAGTVTEVLIGRSDSGGLNVRFVGADEVFAARGASLWDFDASQGGYVDRELLALDDAGLDSILVEAPNGSVTLVRTGEAWTPDVVPVGRVVDESAVDRLVRAVTSVRMTEPTALGADALGATPTRVTWSGTSGDEAIGGALLVGQADGTNRRVRLADSSHVVLVSESALRPILDASPTSLSKEPSSE